MDHNGRNHRSNASTGNKNHINLLRYTAPAIFCLKHKPIVLNSLAGHRKNFRMSGLIYSIQKSVSTKQR